MPTNAEDVAREACGRISSRLGDMCAAGTRIVREIIDFPCKPTFGERRGISCTWDSDKVTRAIERSLKAVAEVAETISGWFRANFNDGQGEQYLRELVERTHYEFGESLSAHEIVVHTQNLSSSFSERFRAATDYANRNGFSSAFPNFHQTDHGQGVVYGTVLLRRECLEIEDVSRTDLGNPNSLEDLFRAITDFAGRKGFPAAFPNFHQADHGSGVVYNVVFLRREAIEIADAPRSELRNPDTIEEHFRAVSDFANSKGFPAAIPNFHRADHGRGVVYGTVLIRREALEIVDVPRLLLHPDLYSVRLLPRNTSTSSPRTWTQPVPGWDRYRGRGS